MENPRVYGDTTAEYLERLYGGPTRPNERILTTTGTVTQIMGNNPRRLFFTFTNLSTSPAYVSTKAEFANATQGDYIPPNGGIEVLAEEDGEAVAGEWWVNSVVGAVLYVRETVRV